MRLFLIRHGETVDNVAGVYAGSRDSALTVHGVLQTRQLAEHIQPTRPRLTHIFASPLQRAYKTAEALRAAQIADSEDDVQHESVGQVITAADLVEQDFGFYEGKPFYARSQGSSKSGKQTHYDAHKSEAGFVDVESKQALDVRSTRFIVDFLIPLLATESIDEPLCVAVVSHGILLSHLWRCLLRMLPPRSVTVAPEVLAQRGEMTLERLGGFSNTGFLELLVLPQDEASTARDGAALDEGTLEALCASNEQVLEPAVQNDPTDLSMPAGSSPPTVLPPQLPRLNDYRVEILVVNGQKHLQGVKRARGGIGRMRYDEGQKTLDSFFKKPKRS